MTHRPHFSLDRTIELPALGGTYLEFNHPSGAKLIHLQTPDSCKVFSASFYTPVPDDSGVAHVLEHMVLCGSKKYPSRKPFFDLQSRSLRDYMNASTTRDWTAFTFASSVEQDFFNLLDVYLDACFHPLLLDGTFHQEAWRVTETGELQGVVMNEMKGGMAHAARQMREMVTRTLFPGSAFAHNSGGDPVALQHLTANQVREYHQQHYHAGNVCFFSCGDVPLQDLLEKLEQVLDTVPVGPAVSRITCPQPPLPELHCTHPGTEQVLLVWPTVPQTATLEHFALSLLTFVWLSHPGAPLHAALLKHGYALADFSGFHSETEVGVFAAGVKGTTDADLVEQWVRECLSQPIPEELIEAALTRFELEDRDHQHGQVPYGVKLMFNVFGAHHHGADPALACTLTHGIEQLRSLPDRSAFLRGLIDRHLLGENRPSRIVMHAGEGTPAPLFPAQHLQTQLQQQEQAPLPPVRCGLPRLDLHTLSPVCEGVETHTEQLQGIPVRFVPLPEPGLTHLTLTVQTADLSAGEWDTLALLQVALGRMGTSSQSQAHLAARMQQAGTQWQPSVDVFHDPACPTRTGAQLLINLKGLSEHLPAALNLLGDWLTGMHFDPDTVQAVLTERIRTAEQMLLMNGHQFAVLQASRRVNPGLQWREQLDGLQALQTFQQQLNDPLIPAELALLHQQLFQRARMEVLVCAHPAEKAGVFTALQPFLAGFEPGTPARVQWVNWPVQEVGGHWQKTLPSPVASNAWAFQTVPYLHPDAGNLYVLARFLHEHFHTLLREQGGAYGAMGRAAPEQGLLICASLRDPHVERTLHTFQTAAQLTDQITEEQMYAARLSSYRQIRPLLSSAWHARKTVLDELRGYTPAVRTHFLEQVLAATAPDLQRVARQHLQGGASAVLAPQEVLHVAD